MLLARDASGARDALGSRRERASLDACLEYASVYPARVTNGKVTVRVDDAVDRHGARNKAAALN